MIILYCFTIPCGFWSLNNIIYVNLPAGDYTFHLAIFDSAGDRVLEERKFELIKEGEFYEHPGFTVYMLLLLSAFLIWFTWFVVQRQLNNQQIKLNMANETVMAIANAVDAKDVRTHQHSLRVAEYSELIAREMGCFKGWQKNKTISNLKKAAQLHDIGKIGIPDEIINKTTKLTDDEFNLRAAKHRFEKELIERALKQCGGNRARTADLLCISRTVLYKKLEQYGIG